MKIFYINTERRCRVGWRDECFGSMYTGILLGNEGSKFPASRMSGDSLFNPKAARSSSWGLVSSASAQLRQYLLHTAEYVPWGTAWQKCEVDVRIFGTPLDGRHCNRVPGPRLDAGEIEVNILRIRYMQ